MGGKFAKPASKRKRRRSGLSRRKRRWLPRQKSGITAAGKKKNETSSFRTKTFPNKEITWNFSKRNGHKQQNCKKRDKVQRAGAFWNSLKFECIFEHRIVIELLEFLIWEFCDSIWRQCFWAILEEFCEYSNWSNHFYFSLQTRPNCLWVIENHFNTHWNHEEPFKLFLNRLQSAREVLHWMPMHPPWLALQEVRSG